LIYLDTHIVVWLYAGQVSKLTEGDKSLINSHQLYISAIVSLELQYLYEIKRISVKAEEIVADLSKRIGLEISAESFGDIINEAIKYSWTRDPFDRIIVANAALNDSILLTKDKRILSNYRNARG